MTLTYRDEIYCYTILVFLKKEYYTLKEFKKALKPYKKMSGREFKDLYLDINEEVEKSDYLGITVSAGNISVIVMNEEFLKTMQEFQKTILHEIIHAVAFQKRRVGIELNQETEEVYAYHISHIYTEILNKITNELHRARESDNTEDGSTE